MEILSHLLFVTSHVLIGFYFAFFGFWNIYHWRPLLMTLNERNIPMPQLVLSIGIAVQVIAGGMIMFVNYVKPATLVLLPFTIIAVYIFHPFWKFKGEDRKLNFTLFFTNITVTLGALLHLLS